MSAFTRMLKLAEGESVSLPKALKIPETLASTAKCHLTALQFLVDLECYFACDHYERLNCYQLSLILVKSIQLLPVSVTKKKNKKL